MGGFLNNTVWSPPQPVVGLGAVGTVLTVTAGGLAFLGGSSGRLISTSGAPILLTGSGTYTPSTGANAIFVYILAGGGGGGGAQFTASGSAAGGGGGGGYGMKFQLLNALTAPITFSVGGGGAGGIGGGANGVAGGNTTIADASVTLNMSALGGTGAATSTDGTFFGRGAAAGGAGGGGLVNISGTPGFPSLTTGAAILAAGQGGHSPYGPGGQFRNTPGNGIAPASVYGGGGGGAWAAAANQNGAAGQPGLIFIWEYT